MKKKLLLCLLIILAIACVMLACGKKTDDGPITEPTDPPAVEFIGAADIHLAISVTSYNFLGSVTVKLESGETAVPAVDSSKVVFGAKGIYDLTYSYEEETKTVKVYVYSAPEIVFDPPTLELEYEGAEDGLYNGVTARDCFGNALEAGLLGFGTFFNSDGTVNIGSHTVGFATTDRVGQFASASRTVTVVMDPVKGPSSAVSSVNADVGEFTFAAALDTKSEAIALLSVGSVLITDYTYAGGTLTVDVDALNDVELGAHTLRVVTRHGAVEWELTLKDELNPVVDSFGQNNRIYQVNTLSALPSVNQLRPRQEITVGYTITPPSGSPPAANSGMFTPTVIGAYTVSAAVKKGGVTKSTVVFSAKVLSSADFADIAFWGASAQHEGKVAESSKVSAEYTEADLGGGNEGFYKITKLTSEMLYPYNDWALALNLKRGYLELEIFIPNGNGEAFSFCTFCGLNQQNSNVYNAGGKLLDAYPEGKWVKVYAPLYGNNYGADEIESFWISAGGAAGGYYYLRSAVRVASIPASDWKNSTGVSAGYYDGLDLDGYNGGVYKVTAKVSGNKPLEGNNVLKLSGSASEMSFAKISVFIPSGTTAEALNFITDKHGISLASSTVVVDGHNFPVRGGGFGSLPVNVWFDIYAPLYAVGVVDSLLLGMGDVDAGVYYYVKENVQTVSALPALSEFHDSASGKIYADYTSGPIGGYSGDMYKITGKEAGITEAYLYYVYSRAITSADHDKFIKFSVYIPAGNNGALQVATEAGHSMAHVKIFIGVNRLDNLDGIPADTWVDVYMPIWSYSGSAFWLSVGNVDSGKFYYVKEDITVVNAIPSGGEFSAFESKGKVSSGYVALNGVGGYTGGAVKVTARGTGIDINNDRALTINYSGVVTWKISVFIPAGTSASAVFAHATAGENSYHVLIANGFNLGASAIPIGVWADLYINEYSSGSGGYIWLGMGGVPEGTYYYVRSVEPSDIPLVPNQSSPDGKVIVEFISEATFDDGIEVTSTYKVTCAEAGLPGQMEPSSSNIISTNGGSVTFEVYIPDGMNVTVEAFSLAGFGSHNWTLIEMDETPIGGVVVPTGRWVKITVPVYSTGFRLTMQSSAQIGDYYYVRNIQVF